MATVSPVIATSSTASPSPAGTAVQPKQHRLFDQTFGNYRQQQLDKQAKDGKSMPRLSERSAPEDKMPSYHHAAEKNMVNRKHSVDSPSSVSKKADPVQSSISRDKSSVKESTKFQDSKSDHTEVSEATGTSKTSCHHPSDSKGKDIQANNHLNSKSDNSKQDKSVSSAEQLLERLQQSQFASSKMKSNEDSELSNVHDGKDAPLSAKQAEAIVAAMMAKSGHAKGDEKVAHEAQSAPLTAKQAEAIVAAVMARLGHAKGDEKSAHEAQSAPLTAKQAEAIVAAVMAKSGHAKGDEKTAHEAQSAPLTAKQAEAIVAAVMAKSGHAKGDEKVTHMTKSDQDKSHKDDKHHETDVSLITLTMVDTVTTSTDTKKLSKESLAEDSDATGKKHSAKVSLEQKVQAQISHSDHKHNKVADTEHVDLKAQNKEHLSGQLLTAKQEQPSNKTGDDVSSFPNSNKPSKDSSADLNRITASHIASTNKSDGLPSHPSSIAQSVHQSISQQSTSIHSGALERQANASADAMQSQMTHKGHNEAQGIQTATNTHHESVRQAVHEHATPSISASSGQTHDQPNGGFGGQTGQSMGHNLGQSGASSSANTARADSSLGNLSMNNNPNLSQELNERVNYMVSHKLQSADIRLDPAHLGAMQIRLNLHHDQAQLQIHVHNPQARDMLEQTMPKLRELLAQQGIQLGQSQISQQQSGQQGNQSGGQGFLQSNDSRSFTAGANNNGSSSEPDLDDVASRPVYHTSFIDDGIDYYA